MFRLRGHLPSVRAAAGNPAAAVRGYRFARSLPASGPAEGARDPGRLEQYFDAYTEGPSIHKWRHYFAIYERHLARFAGQEVHLVEVGVQRGGSLLMWREFLGPRCHVHGIDIDPACAAHAAERIDVHIGDQGSPDFWADFRRRVPRVDVLIDDGGHEPHQQMTTLEAMLPHLRPGGVYVCEDIHGAFQPFHAFIEGLSRSLHSLRDTIGPPSAIHQHVESVHLYPFATVLEKPAVRPGRFEGPRHGSDA